MNNKLKGILGICRKAGKMSIGHDAVIGSVKNGHAKLVICCADASQRLKREISDECSYMDRDVPYEEAAFDKNALSLAIGNPAAVISIDDAGFAKKVYIEMTGGNASGS